MKSFLNKIFGNKEERIAKKKAEENAIKFSENQKIKALLDNKGSVELRLDVPSKKEYLAIIQKDEFNGDLSIKFKQVASYVNDKLITWADGDFCPLDIGFRFENKEHLMAIETYQKILKMKKGDKLSFLFDDGEIVEFEIPEKGYKVNKDEDGVIIESKFSISQSQLEKFDNFLLKKWRYTPIDGSQLRTGTIKPEVKNDIGEMTSAYRLLTGHFLKE